MSKDKNLLLLLDSLFNENIIEHLTNEKNSARRLSILFTFRENQIMTNDENFDWVNKYTEVKFYELFRMRKETFESLLHVIIENDTNCLIKKKYRGGNYPVSPVKSLLVFLYYISHQDNLNTIAETFQLATATVMNIVNIYLYVVIFLKKKYIFWPTTNHEFDYIIRGFQRYPGTMGCIDGSHINIKVPLNQHDSYADRYLNHSVNLMGICNADRIFMYIFVGFPGSAHDSRVFNNSSLVRDIEQYGANKFFLDVEKYHIIGDSAFPIRRWLMTPYKGSHLSDRERNHNYHLSAARVIIENTFGHVKGRWRRLIFVNTYNVCKAIEIITAACILHNFCILNKDIWTGDIEREQNEEVYAVDNVQEQHLAREKRDRIAEALI